MPLEVRDSKKYAIIVGGKIAIKAEEGARDSVKREYKTSAGVEGVKWEYLYDNLRGIIQDIEIVPSDFGDQIHVLIDGITLSLGAASQYGNDFMKKIPTADLTKELNIVPWKMEKDGKIKSGLVIYQGFNEKEGKAIKLTDYFYDWENKKCLHDFPSPENKVMDSDDWKMYFIKVKKFLIEYIKENIIPKVSKFDLTEEKGIDVSDIPFEN